MDCATIQQALISAVQDESGQFKQVDASVHNLPDVIGTMPLRPPVCFVDGGRCKYRRLDNAGAEVTVEFTLHLVIQDGSRLSDTIIDSVLGTVSNSTLGLSIEPLNPISAERINAPAGLALYEIKLETRYDHMY